MPYTPLEFPTLPANPNFQDISTWLTEASQNLVNSGNANLEDLKDLSEIDFNSIGTSPNYNSVVWTTGVIVPLAPERPAIPMADLSTIIQQIQLLVPPAAPSNTFSYTDPGYDSVLRAHVADKLAFDLINGGYGIDINDEQALFDRARDRENQAYMQAEAEVLRRSAITGFTLPQGALSKQLEKAQMDRVQKLSDINREITLKRADLYVLNRRQTIEQAITFEGQGIELYNAMQNRLLLAARTEIEMAVFLYDSGIKLFTAQLEQLSKQGELSVASTNAIISVYSADIQRFAAVVNAFTQAANIDVANSRNILERDIRVYNSQVQIVQDRLRQLIATTENRKEIAKYLTEFFRTALGSAMNGINGLAVQTGDAPAAA